MQADLHEGAALPIPVAVKGGQSRDALTETAEIGEKGLGEMREGLAVGLGFGQHARQRLFGIAVSKAGGAAGISQRALGTGNGGGAPGFSQQLQIPAVGLKTGAQKGRSKLAPQTGKRKSMASTAITKPAMVSETRTKASCQSPE